jgi:hypothetical protein
VLEPGDPLGARMYVVGEGGACGPWEDV